MWPPKYTILVSLRNEVRQERFDRRWDRSARPLGARDVAFRS
jgi:hypothetical protein